jgi:hypothetical protein
MRERLMHPAQSMVGLADEMMLFIPGGNTKDSDAKLGQRCETHQEEQKYVGLAHRQRGRCGFRSHSRQYTHELLCRQPSTSVACVAASRRLEVCTRRAGRRRHGECDKRLRSGQDF